MNVQQAIDKGAKDFFSGNHRNPFDAFEDGELFRAWVEGYRIAKTIAETIEEHDRLCLDVRY